jgi:type II secretory pathway pseudopilin PulG
MQPLRTHDRRTRKPNRRTGADSGYSLAEILVAVVLMGSIIVAIMGAMWAVVRSSAQNDDLAKVQAVLGSAADRIANYKYLECPEQAEQYPDYNAVSYARVGKAAVESVGWPDSTIEIIDYQFWNPTTSSWQDSNTIQGTDCNETVGLTTSKTMQKITIRVTAPSGNSSSTIDIVKSDIQPKEIRDVSTP